MYNCFAYFAVFGNHDWGNSDSEIACPHITGARLICNNDNKNSGKNNKNKLLAKLLLFDNKHHSLNLNGFILTLTPK